MAIKKLGMFSLGLFWCLLLGCADKADNNVAAGMPNVIDEKPTRVERDFNFGWLFSLNENADAFAVDYADQHWKNIRLPHDWSIEANYTQENTAGATGYLPGGMGWYRKHFATPSEGDRTYIYFDGIYNHSEIWINGHSLGKRPYGYVPFYHDLTPYLNPKGQDNIMAVRVDRTRYIDSRWYTGSGIYRDVKLISTANTHIPIWGNYVITPEVSQNQAKVKVSTDIVQKHAQVLAETSHDIFTLVTEILSPNGRQVATTAQELYFKQVNETTVDSHLTVVSPALWQLDSPNMYTAVTRLFKNSIEIDKTQTPFGIRTLKNDPAKGFFLNGRSIKIKGVNLHHDAGLVGAAVPKDVWRRRLLTLKEAGVNAIRTAHNAPSAEFLDLCDEMGFLVQNEIFDEWDNPKNKRKNFNLEGQADYATQSYSEYFADWAERDLKATVKRDRNHPSIIQWSIGNEIEWTYPRYTSATGYWGKDKTPGLSYYWDAPPYSIEKSQSKFDSIPIKGAELAKTAANLAKWTKEMDLTRPVTANLVTPSVSHFSGYADTLDIIGYSYRQSVYEYGRKNYPDKMILGTENWVQWHEWEAVKDKDYIAGIFVWTGIDYLGESNDSWPKKGTSSGMLDFAGFKKPSFHMMKTLWNDEPYVYLTTQPLNDSVYKLVNKTVVEKEVGAWRKGKWSWRDMQEHWNYQADEVIVAEVYTNQSAVELFLNDKSLGVQYLAQNEDHILKWAVPFKPGKLEARVVSALVKAPASSVINSATDLHQVKLTSDKTYLTADGYSVAHITAQLVDKQGNPVKHINRKITFNLQGNARFLGVDNGANNNIQPHYTNSIITDRGRALFIVQSNLIEAGEKLGVVTINAQSQGLVSSTVKLRILAAQPQ